MSKVNEVSQSKKRSFSDTYRYVMNQKKKIDEHLYKLQEQLLSMVQHRKGDDKGSYHKMYVPRVENSQILLDSILSIMIPGKEMKMSQIMNKIKNRQAYKTNSKYFYTMVNNKLNRQDLKLVGPIRRGVFVFKPTLKQQTEMKAYQESNRKDVVKAPSGK